jgi:hypothetical protein
VTSKIGDKTWKHKGWLLVNSKPGSGPTGIVYEMIAIISSSAVKLYSETRTFLTTECERWKNARSYVNGIGMFVVFGCNALLTCNNLIMKNQLCGIHRRLFCCLDS